MARRLLGADARGLGAARTGHLAAGRAGAVAAQADEEGWETRLLRGARHRARRRALSNMRPLAALRTVEGLVEVPPGGRRVDGRTGKRHLHHRASLLRL